MSSNSICVGIEWLVELLFLGIDVDASSLDGGQHKPAAGRSTWAQPATEADKSLAVVHGDAYACTRTHQAAGIWTAELLLCLCLH